MYRLKGYIGYPGLLLGTCQPDIRPTGDRTYISKDEFTITVQCPDRGWEVIKVPEGFNLDGASIPRLAWSVSGLTPDGLIRAASLVHDFLYRRRGMKRFTRKEADLIFLDLMRAAGMKTKAKLAYRAVRLFGSRW